jgi:hypothetical protein
MNIAPANTPREAGVARLRRGRCRESTRRRAEIGRSALWLVSSDLGTLSNDYQP